MISKLAMDKLDKEKLKFELRKNISKNIRKYRLLHKITQEDLADSISISHEFLRRFETNLGVEGISIVNLYLIAKELNITIDELLKK